MHFVEIVNEVRERLGDKARSHEETAKIIREALNVIMDATVEGVNVKILGFGHFKATTRRSTGINCKGRKFIQVYLKTCRAWRARCRIEKNMEASVEKYGVELDKNDKGAKTAAEQGKCPACGKGLSGNPPICPDCGSKPLEKRRGDA